MTQLNIITAAKGFRYSPEPQGSPGWVEMRVGKITASRLKDWLAVGVKGQPLKARADYERELAFEMQFKTPFSRFVTAAMEEGILAEEQVKQQYSSTMGVVVQPVGAFYNDKFVASPDGLVGDKGLIECKWLYDTSFSDVLANGVPDDYNLQIQGQLMASGRDWCDFVAANGNTGYFKVIRVARDEAIIQKIKDSLDGLGNIDHTFNTNGLYKLTNTINFNRGAWE